MKRRCCFTAKNCPVAGPSPGITKSYSHSLRQHAHPFGRAVLAVCRPFPPWCAARWPPFRLLCPLRAGGKTQSCDTNRRYKTAACPYRQSAPRRYGTAPDHLQNLARLITFLKKTRLSISGTSMPVSTYPPRWRFAATCSCRKNHQSSFGHSWYSYQSPAHSGSGNRDIPCSTLPVSFRRGCSSWQI